MVRRLLFLVALAAAGARAADEPAACESCRLLAGAFRRRLDATAPGPDGRLDLDSVHRRACDAVGRDVQPQCRQDALRLRPQLDEWWALAAADPQLDLATWLCEQRLQVCCPKGHFGPECQRCPETEGGVCGGNGRCRGEGTRSGNGTCVCDRGYQGALCQECTERFHEAFRDERILICAPCYAGCHDTCTGPGPQGCASCASGWLPDPQLGCQDIDECVSFTGACGAGQFCVNTQGSYACLECDRACKSCNGDGPDMCDECADGFYEKQGVCLEVQQQQISQQAVITRYVTYAGLCVATFIVFNKNTWLAMGIGAAVSAYITLAEYLYGESSWQQLTNLLRLSD